MSKYEKITGELPAAAILTPQLFHNIDALLRYYRFAAAFCANAVDSLEWYLEGSKYNSEVQAIRDSRLVTMHIMSHINRMLETYRLLCEQDGSERKYNVIIRKYIDPPGGIDGKGKPFSNQRLADLFDCSEETIKRDIRCAKAELSILIFGADFRKKGSQ